MEDDTKSGLAHALLHVVERIGYGGFACVLWTLILCVALLRGSDQLFRERWWWFVGTWYFFAGVWATLTLVGTISVSRTEKTERADEEEIAEPRDPPAGAARG